MERGLVLPQLNIQDFVDSSWEGLPLWRTAWGLDEGKVAGKAGGGGSGKENCGGM